MKIVTALPFAHILFKHWGPTDEEGLAVIVKGSFAIRPDGHLEVMAQPEPLLESDLYFGDPATSSLRAEQDLAPDKPRTDVTFDLVARAPGDAPLTDWPVSVEIPGRAFYAFHVRGPCHWEKRRGGWQLSRPTPVREVPIRYELAFGGQAEGKDGPETFAFNPVGLGFVTDHRLSQDQPVAAPQIGDLAEFAVTDIRKSMTVHGLGPLAKTWLPRRAEAGTFDDRWKATRHPRMPLDYSFGFWNAAPRRLQMDPYLRGDEQIRLQGFHHDSAAQSLTLPRVGLCLHRDGEDGTPLRMNLTDVQIDMSHETPTQHRATLIWRLFLPRADNVSRLRVDPIALEDTA